MSKPYSPTDKFSQFKDGDIKGFRYYLIIIYHGLYPYSFSITQNQNMTMKIIFHAFQSCWLERYGMLNEQHLLGTARDIVTSDSRSYRRATMNSTGNTGSGNGNGKGGPFDIDKLYKEMKFDIHQHMSPKEKRTLKLFHELSKKGFTAGQEMKGKENVQLSRTIRSIWTMMSKEKF